MGSERFRVVLAQGERLREVRDDIFVVGQLKARDAAVVVCERVAWIELDRLTVRSDRALVVVLFLERVALLESGLRLGGVHVVSASRKGYGTEGCC
jgi:hypothetical protein